MPTISATSFVDALREGNQNADAGTSSGAAKDKVKDKQEAPKPEEPVVFVDEDFRTTYKKGLTIPENWSEGEAFRVIKEENAYALEVSKASGNHFVYLPPMRLSGDFFIEGIYLLPNTRLKFSVSLENRKQSALLPIIFSYDGGVLIADDARLPPPDQVPYKPTHFLIKREGKRLRVFLDKKPVADKELDDIAEYSTVRIGMVAGKGFGRRGARLYGIRVGTLSDGGQVPLSNLKAPESTGRPIRGKKGG